MRLQGLEIKQAPTWSSRSASVRQRATASVSARSAVSSAAAAAHCSLRWDPLRSGPDRRRCWPHILCRKQASKAHASRWPSSHKACVRQRGSSEQRGAVRPGSGMRAREAPPRRPSQAGAWVRAARSAADAGPRTAAASPLPRSPGRRLPPAGRAPRPRRLRSRQRRGRPPEPPPPRRHRWRHARVRRCGRAHLRMARARSLGVAASGGRPWRSSRRPSPAGLVPGVGCRRGARRRAA